MITEEELTIRFEPRGLPRARDLESQIGNTPLLRLGRVAHGLPVGVEILVKA